MRVVKRSSPWHRRPKTKLEIRKYNLKPRDEAVRTIYRLSTAAFELWNSIAQRRGAQDCERRATLKHATATSTNPFSIAISIFISLFAQTRKYNTQSSISSSSGFSVSGSMVHQSSNSMMECAIRNAYISFAELGWHTAPSGTLNVSNSE